MSAAMGEENCTSLKLSVYSLLSPPESKQYDTFTSIGSSTSQDSLALHGSEISNPSKRSIQMAEKISKNRFPLSPPVSPYATTRRESGGYGLQDYSEKDPQLFRSNDYGNALSADIPLFSNEKLEAPVKDIVAHHIAAREKFEKPIASPTTEEYFLAVSCVAKGYNRNPLAWLRREREWLNSHYGKTDRVSKPKSPVVRRIAPMQPSSIRRSKPTSVIAKVPRAKRTPKAKVYDSLDEPRSPKAPRLPTNRDDVDYQSLPDYSPSLSTLPKGNNKILKADWKGQMLDLSNDPDRHLLHEAEVTLAATLRLSCATYICSKRRIFQARIEALRIGKEFRKTDAQQACKIDVNKASKLWSAYDRVGWLKKELFQQYL